MKKFLILISIITLTGLASCQSNIPTNNQALTTNSMNISSKNTVRGIVQFPKTGFRVKTISQVDVASDATVSIAYPSDATLANKVIASGLTSNNGAFAINTYSDFNPTTGDIFVLEASKRIGGVGSYLMTLRTFIKWNGTDWESMTTGGIYINTYTTALSIIDNYSAINAEDTIGKIAVSNGVVTPSNVGVTPNIITAQTISDVSTFVENALQKEQDPVFLIKYSDGKFYLDRNLDTNAYNLDKLLQTGTCNSCDFSSVNLLNITFKNLTLIGSNLSGLDFSDRTLISNDLTQADLSKTNLFDKNLTSNTLLGINLSNANLEKAVLSGKTISDSTTHANLSDAYMVNTKLIHTVAQNANFQYSYLMLADLTEADLSNSDLKNADLTGATINQTDFSGADLSGTKWVDGTTFVGTKICGSNSIDECN